MGKEILFTEQQIEQLKEKGLIIESINNAKEILKHFSSFDVIEVYEKLFMKDGRFKENITIAPPIMRFGVKDSCKSIIPITAAITLSRESNTPFVVADTCFIPYSIKKKGNVVQNTVRYIN